MRLTELLTNNFCLSSKYCAWGNFVILILQSKIKAGVIHFISILCNKHFVFKWPYHTIHFFLSKCKYRVCTPYLPVYQKFGEQILGRTPNRVNGINSKHILGRTNILSTMYNEYEYRWFLLYWQHLQLNKTNSHIIRKKDILV